MKTLTKVFCLIGGLGLSASSWGGGAGTSTGDFLTLGSGSRLAGLGGGGTALIDDASALYWNPGAMTEVPKRSAVLLHTSYLESTSFSQASYVENLGGAGAVGMSLNYFSSGDIPQNDINGIDDGSFSPNDMAVTVGYAKKVGPVSVGGAGKYVKSTIVESASTLAMDLGVQSRPLLNDRLRLAASGYNLGGTLKYESESEDLPQEYRLGAAYRVTSKVNLVLDGAFPKSADTYFAGGAEFIQEWGDDWGLGLRAGYSSRTAGDVSGLTGITFGLGVSRGPLGIDYAMVPQGDLGMTHWIALVYRQ
jgi:hypothetical protein